jgi:O-antigen chain-terminating methyltransferase
MIETNIKNLSVEEIMQKIKEEVEKRKNNIENTNFSQNSGIKKEYESIIHKKEMLFRQKDIYEYSDFTIYHDIEFIQNVYRGLLKREADNEGLNHYLELLRSGAKSKSEIISLIRYSKEVKIKMLLYLVLKKDFY